MAGYDWGAVNQAAAGLTDTIRYGAERPERQRFAELRNQMLQQEMEQNSMTLAEAYRKQQEDEAVRAALANPPTQTTFAPPRPVTPGAGGLQADPSLTEITGRQQKTPTQIIAETRMGQGRVEEAVNAINLDDKLAEYGAKVQAGNGDVREYYRLKQDVDQAKEFFGVVKEYKKNPAMLKQLWPLVVKAYPRAAAIDPESLIQEDGLTLIPATTRDGRVIPNLYGYLDEAGTVHIKEVKPDAEALLDKRLAADAAKTDKLIAAADARAERRLAVSGGNSPVAQSTFVNPDTGKPLVFDKRTGTYREAIVEGGVTAKPPALTPEAAAKAQLVEQGLTYIPKIRSELIDKNGKVNRTHVVNIAARTPYTKGRELSTYILDAVEAKLRAESGAAVPEPEVKRAAKRFIPQVADNDSTIKVKIDNLERFLKGTSDKINRGRGTSKSGKVSISDFWSK